MESRVYFVIDMKSFFASCECAMRNLDPMKANLVVADASRTEKTICLAVSVNMKRLGVRNRCRLFEVPKNIDFIIAPPQMRKYIEYAAEIYSIYLKYMSKEDIHVYSIDECFLDVTDYLKLYKMKAKPFAKMLMNEIYEKLHIPATCGIGTNMYLAKIASAITAKKATDRIGWLTEEKFNETLKNHRPLTDFWMISHGIASHLERLHIYDMEGISKADPDMLYKEFGVNAELLIDHSRGYEPTTMADIKNYKGKGKSISSSQILPEAYTYEDAKIILKEMIQNGIYDLNTRNEVCKVVGFRVRLDGGGYLGGTAKLDVATNLYSVISEEIEKLFDKQVPKDAMIRGLGFGFSGLLPENYEHYDLFTDLNKVSKEHKITNSVMKIKEKYGKNSVLKGIDYTEKATVRERNKMIGGHRSGEK